MTQIAFWTSYSFLPPELSGNMGYWGILGSGAFVFIARHFAMVRFPPIIILFGLLTYSSLSFFSFSIMSGKWTSSPPWPFGSTRTRSGATRGPSASSKWAPRRCSTPPATWPSRYVFCLVMFALSISFLCIHSAIHASHSFSHTHLHISTQMRTRKYSAKAIPFGTCWTSRKANLAPTTTRTCSCACSKA